VDLEAVVGESAPVGGWRGGGEAGQTWAGEEQEEEASNLMFLTVLGYCCSRTIDDGKH
jgi:hypothetical protein